MVIQNLKGVHYGLPDHNAPPPNFFTQLEHGIFTWLHNFSIKKINLIFFLSGDDCVLVYEKGRADIKMCQR